MTDKELITKHDSLFKFLEAQDKAEKRQEDSFTCPLCGGVAVWGRAKENNHAGGAIKKGLGNKMTNLFYEIISVFIAVLIGGVIVPIVLNWLRDKWGWFK